MKQNIRPIIAILLAALADRAAAKRLAIRRDFWAPFISMALIQYLHGVVATHDDIRSALRCPRGWEAGNDHARRFSAWGRRKDRNTGTQQRRNRLLGLNRPATRIDILAILSKSCRIVVGRTHGVVTYQFECFDQRFDFMSRLFEYLAQSFLCRSPFQWQALLFRLGGSSRW